MAHPHRDALTTAARVMKDRGMTHAAIAKAFGVSEATVGYWLNPVIYEKHKQYVATVRKKAVRSRKGAILSENPERDAEIVRQRNTGMTLQAIADHHGIHHTRVLQILNRMQPDRKRQVHTKGQAKAMRDADVLRMRKAGKPVPAIVEAHGITATHVYAIIRKAMKAQAESMPPRPAETTLRSPQAQQAAAIRAKWLAIAQQNA
jgi:DNA invertase Pin-like site-specific DNA recombinase